MNIVSKDENKKLIESEKRVLEFIAKTITRYLLQDIFRNHFEFIFLEIFT